MFSSEWVVFSNRGELEQFTISYRRLSVFYDFDSMNLANKNTLKYNQRIPIEGKQTSVRELASSIIYDATRQ